MPKRGEKMSNETKIGQLVIDLQIKTQALEKGLETAQKKLKEIEEQNEEVKSSNKGLEASYLALSAAAVAALAKISSVIKDSVEEYKAYTQAMSSLQNVSEYTGQSMSEFAEIMDKFGTYMTQADLATTIKNFSLMGFTAQQTEQMIEALTNSAIRNRNANYTVSEAVRVASEGYRQGLSTLSDSAGVTENLSVMLDNYAKSIGKTASQLTEAEKNQAYLNRTMYAAEPFAGAMSDYLDSLAGKQGQYSQAMRETQVAYAEALEPTLSSLTELGAQVLGFVNAAIEKQPELTAGATAFATTLAAVTVALIALAAAKKTYATATGVATVSTKAFTAALLANPLTQWAIAISAAVGLITTIATRINSLKNKLDELKEKLNETSEAQERLNKIMQGTIELTDENIEKIRQDKEAAEARLKILKETIASEKELQNLRSEKTPKFSEENNNNTSNDRVQRLIQNNSRLAGSYSMVEKQITAYNKVLYENMETERAEYRQQLINIAQTKVDINGKQELLNILKQGKTATEEYADAKSKLVKVYPELANVNENTIASTQKAIDAENAAADAAWANAQVAIQASILEVSAMASNKEQIIALANATKQSVEEVTASLQNQINVLGNLSNLTPDDFKGSVTSNYTPKRSSSSSYSNKALDNYKKQLEYKKSLDQLSIKDEIAGYEYALSKYAKTQDEKQELTKKIYELKKELQEEELNEYLDYIDYKKSLDQISAQEEINMYQYAYENLAKTTEQKRDLEVTLYELRKELQEKEEEDQQSLLDEHIEYIQYKKSLDQLSAQEEIDAYQYAYDYLAKTVEQKRDLEITLYDLRKQLAKEEAEQERKLLNEKVKQYEQYIELQKQQKGASYDVTEQTADLDKIIQLHKDYLEQILEDERYSLEERKEIYEEELETIRDYENQKRELRINSIDNTVQQLKSAITKQLQEMQKADKEAIQENIKLVEQWKEARVNAINEEYNTRIEAIQKELDLLDKSEQEKTRAEEDAEYERKKLRLEQLVKYEHDATTKANYEKELAKLTEEYQKTLNDRALEDKKEALKAEKDLLKEEQSNKVSEIEAEADKQKEMYESQLDELEEYYDKQIDMAEETAQKMLLNVDTNQQQILDLLKKYGNDYEITGQSLGEKLAQGINNGIADKIQSIVKKIQDSIDSAINNKIASWTESIYKYEAGIDKPTTTGKSITVQQYNTIQQNLEMPSETYRKLNNVSQKLAEEFAGW